MEGWGDREWRARWARPSLRLRCLAGKAMEDGKSFKEVRVRVSVRVSVRVRVRFWVTSGVATIGVGWWAWLGVGWLVLS